MRLKGLGLERRLRRDMFQVYRTMKVIDKVDDKQLFTKCHNFSEQKLVRD